MKPLNEELVMTQEDKELLLKDFCARLPYEIKGIRIYKPEEVVTLNEIIPRCKMNPNIGNGSFCELGFDKISDFCTIAEFKPYLFPLSSLTEEQRNYISKLLIDTQNEFPPYGELNTKGYDNLFVCSVKQANVLINYCLTNHLDINGLIEKGIAIDATGLNIY